MRQAGAGTPGDAARASSSQDSPQRAFGRADEGGGETGPPPSAPRTSTRVLVVDDEPAVRRFVADALARSGYDVVVAGNGREALARVYADHESPALLITDIEMPGMSGVELAARVRADRPGIRVVLMTGREASAARARERAGLVEAVLLKPFALAELLDAVFETIGEPTPG
jgi:CheY-like chemotaxis protein